MILHLLVEEKSIDLCFKSASLCFVDKQGLDEKIPIKTWNEVIKKDMLDCGVT